MRDDLIASLSGNYEPPFEEYESAMWLLV
jgi:hypothetical protein